jgi:hypothetical protein
LAVIPTRHSRRRCENGSIGLNVAQPFVQFQTSMLRVFAENIEQAARSYEKSFEVVSSIIAQQSQIPRQ